MTCALNEVACAAFAVGALIDLVDLYVFVDTGSSDGTADLIEHLYEREVEAGRLVIDRLGPLPDHDVSLARGHALERFRAADIGAFLKVDADDVFYDAGANQMVELLRTFPAGTTHASGRSRELYQSEIVDTDEWLRALRDGRDVFWEMDLLPSHDRGFAVAGARARGKWGDEAAGRRPEGIGYAQPGRRVSTEAVVAAHYGWARPVVQKREKSVAWYGRPDGDPRVEGLLLSDDPRAPQRRFRDHPEVVGRQVQSVLDWLDSRAAAPSSG